MAMREPGYSQDEISAAWREARSAGYTESTASEWIGSPPPERLEHKRSEPDMRDRWTGRQHS
jgi:hypothetical protein